MEVSSASITAPNARGKEESCTEYHDYEFRKESDELEAVKVLSTDKDEESRHYKQALKCKKPREILQEEEAGEQIL